MIGITPVQMAGELGRLALVHSSIRMSPECVQVWHEALDDISHELVHRAIKEFIRSDEQFPIPGIIRRIALEIAEDRQRQQHGKRLGRSTVYSVINEDPVDHDKRRKILANMQQQKRLRIESRPRHSEPEPDVSNIDAGILERLRKADRDARERMARNEGQMQ